MRVMQEIIISTDDRIPIRISYPSELTRDELDDLKGTIGIWLRGLERQVKKPTPSTPEAVATTEATPVGEKRAEGESLGKPEGQGKA